MTRAMNNKQGVHFDAPSLGAREKKYLCRAIDSGYASSFGPFVARFEEKFAAYLGVKKAVAVQSGTAAIHMALHELRIGPGDEVIVPALTFAATVNPVLYAGATPVIVDVDPATWNMDPRQVEQHITKRTRAVICVHLYGNPCDLGPLARIAREKNIPLVEDATESLGAGYQERGTGKWGEFGCFSFNGNKLITTGGGGMLVGKDIRRLEHIGFLINQAKDPERPGSHPEMGFNYRMTNLEASLGLAQMERMKGFLKKKAAFAAAYRKELGSCGDVRFQEAYPGAESSFWLNGISFRRDIDIPELRRRLKAQGIPANRIFVPLVGFPYLSDFVRDPCPAAKDVYQRALCLPSSTLNSERDIRRVGRILKKELQRI